MRIVDWNEEEIKSKGFNIIFDIESSENSLLCRMTVSEIEEMIETLNQILDESKTA